MAIFQILVKINLCILAILLLQMPRCCKLGQASKSISLNLQHDDATHDVYSKKNLCDF